MNISIVWGINSNLEHSCWVCSPESSHVFEGWIALNSSLRRDITNYSQRLISKWCLWQEQLLLLNRKWTHEGGHGQSRLDCCLMGTQKWSCFRSTLHARATIRSVTENTWTESWDCFRSRSEQDYRRDLNSKSGDMSKATRTLSSSVFGMPDLVLSLTRMNKDPSLFMRLGFKMCGASEFPLYRSAWQAWPREGSHSVTVTTQHGRDLKCTFGPLPRPSISTPSPECTFSRTFSSPATLH